MKRWKHSCERKMVGMVMHMEINKYIFFHSNFIQIKRFQFSSPFFDSLSLLLLRLIFGFIALNFFSRKIIGTVDINDNIDLETRYIASSLNLPYFNKTTKPKNSSATYHTGSLSLSLLMWLFEKIFHYWFFSSVSSLITVDTMEVCCRTARCRRRRMRRKRVK